MPSLQSVCILIPCFLLLYSSQKPACFSISRDCQMFSHRSDICFHGIYCYASRVFLVCFLGTDQNWSSFDVVVVHPLFVYTQQDTKINPSGEVLLSPRYGCLFAPFLLRRDWLVSWQQQRRRCLSWHSFGWFTLHSAGFIVSLEMWWCASAAMRPLDAQSEMLPCSMQHSMKSLRHPSQL